MSKVYNKDLISHAKRFSLNKQDSIQSIASNVSNVSTVTVGSSTTPVDSDGKNKILFAIG